MNSLNATASGHPRVRLNLIQSAAIYVGEKARFALNRCKLRLLVTFLPLVMLAAWGLSPQPAMAATAAACQDGATTTVDGTIFKVIHYDTGTWLFINVPSWDCSPITILAKDPGACVLGSTIHAEATLSKPGPNDLYEGWKLSNTTASNGAKYISSFSCR